jgi:hypothetical protein
MVVQRSPVGVAFRPHNFEITSFSVDPVDEALSGGDRHSLAVDRSDFHHSTGKMGVRTWNSRERVSQRLSKEEVDDGLLDGLLVEDDLSGH